MACGICCWESGKHNLRMDNSTTAYVARLLIELYDRSESKNTSVYLVCEPCYSVVAAFVGGLEADRASDRLRVRLTAKQAGRRRQTKRRKSSSEENE